MKRLGGRSSRRGLAKGRGKAAGLFVACCIQGATRRQDKLAEVWGDLVRGRLQGWPAQWRSESRAVKGLDPNPEAPEPLEPLSGLYSQPRVYELELELIKVHDVQRPKLPCQCRAWDALSLSHHIHI